MTKSRGTKAAAMACAAAMILSLAACEEQRGETVRTTTTAATTTKAETTTTAETTAETTTIPDNNPPGHFDVFAGWIMLDGELRAIYPLDAIVLLETEEGYSFFYPCNEEFLSVSLTDENLRGVTKKVTDEAEKNGTEYLIQNELETDFEDGMKVYSDGKDVCLLIRDRDTDRNYLSYVQRDYEYQQSLKEEDPESYREMEEEGRIIPYDVPNLDLDQIWYAFYPDPNIEPMKPIETVGTTTTASAAATTKTETTTTAKATTTTAITTEATTTEPEEPSVRETSAEDFKYREVDGEITIIGYYGSDPKVVIPAAIDGKPVTEIGGTSFYQRDIESVVIPDSVTVISSNAFFNCEKLEKIIIPESVERIGWDAFEGTRWLADRQAEDPLVIVNGILVDGTACSSESVTIPDGVKRIAAGAFRECETLTSVTIPDSVEAIGMDAFSRCAALENVIFPDHATEMESAVFADTPWLEKKRAENPLVIVNGNLIDGQTCSGEVTIPDGVRSIAEGVFAFSDMKSVTIPDSVTEISDSAFFCCAALTNVTIPDSVTEISGFAFFGCVALTNVTIPNRVIRIGDYAFAGCGALTGITIPEGVTEIGEEAFSQCYALTSVTLPDGLQLLDNDAFGDNKMTVAYRGKTYTLPAQKRELYKAVNGAE